MMRHGAVCVRASSGAVNGARERILGRAWRACEVSVAGDQCCAGAVCRRRGGHEMRMLQVDELRRAMSFPVWFDFGGCTRTDTMRLLGNAVCPLVMQAIVEELMRCA